MTNAVETRLIPGVLFGERLSDAIVGHDQLDALTSTRQRNANFVGFAMLKRVVDRFLRDTIKRQGNDFVSDRH